MHKFLVVFIAFCCFALSLQGEAATVQDKSTGVAFPTQVSFDANQKHYTLDITGIGTRTKFFMKVYSMAHYLENPVPGNDASIFQQIFDDKKAKQITIQWLLEIDADRLRDGFNDSFKTNLSPSEYQQFKKEIDQFLSFYHDLSKNEVQVMRWLPSGILTFASGGELRGSIKNLDFVVIIWKMWFGKNAAIDPKQLVSMVGKGKQWDQQLWVNENP